MPRRSRNAEVEFEIELERGSQTVEYLVKAEVSPYDPGRTSGPPEKCYPPEGGEVEAKTVYWVETKKCHTCFGAGELKKTAERFKDQPCPTCKGKKVVKIEHERPELEDLVDDEEVMKHLPDGPDEPDRDDD